MVSTEGLAADAPALRTDTTPNASRDGIGTRSAAADAVPAMPIRETNVAAATSVLRIFMRNPPAHALERAKRNLRVQSLGEHDVCHAALILSLVPCSPT